jgi:outer membrane protein TolC
MIHRSLPYRIFFCMFLLGCLSQIPLSAQPAPLPEDIFPELKVLLEQALTQSPTMLQSNLELATAKALRYQSRAPLLPNVSSSISYSKITSSPTESTGVDSTAQGVYYSLFAYQPLYHWGALKAQADIAKIGVKIAEKNYAEAYRNLALSVRAQYLSLVVLKMRQRNAAFTLKVAEDTLQLNEERLQKGTVSLGEIIPIRLGVDEAKLALDNTEADLENSREVLAQTTGLDSLPLENIPEEIPVTSLQYVALSLETKVAGFVETGVKNTNLAMNLSWAIDQANLSYKIQKYRLFPRLGISASVIQANSTSATSTIVSQAGIYSESINLFASWSIFDGFATKGTKLAALAARRTSENALRNYLKTARNQAIRQKQQLMFAYRTMQIAEVRLNIAQGVVIKAFEDMGRGSASQGEVDKAKLNLNYQMLVNATTRAEFLNRATELYSLLNIDPIVGNLSVSDRGILK